MKQLNSLLLTAILLLSSLLAFAGADKAGHKISLTVNNISDEWVLIANYYGNNQYIYDTAYVQKGNKIILEGDESMPPGIYMAVFPSLQNRYFEFIVKEQHFSLETSAPDFVKNMKITNSKENEVFYSDMKFMTERTAKLEKLKSKLEIFKGNADSTKAVKNKMKKLETQIQDNRIAIMNDHPDMYYGKLLKFMKDIEIPQLQDVEVGEAYDTLGVFKYYKKHYWDHMDFSEEGLLRSPLYHNKLKEYVTQVITPTPDTMITYMDALIEQARANDEIFKYTLVYVLNHWAKSKIMCMDAVYVHLVENYYATGDAYWMGDTSVQLVKMIDRAKRIKPTLCGKVAPDVALLDTTLKNAIPLHSIDADYTIILVWDSECGHCKKQMPKFKKLYEKYQDRGVVVYAVNNQPYEEIKKWKKYINENQLNWINVADPYYQTKFRQWYDIKSTPVVMLLDKDKKVLAKRISAEQLEDFLLHEWGEKTGDKIFKEENIDGEDSH